MCDLFLVIEVMGWFGDGVFIKVLRYLGIRAEDMVFAGGCEEIWFLLGRWGYV